jgi:hypothetical protein
MSSDLTLFVMFGPRDVRVGGGHVHEPRRSSTRPTAHREERRGVEGGDDCDGRQGIPSEQRATCVPSVASHVEVSSLQGRTFLPRASRAGQSAARCPAAATEFPMRDASSRESGLARCSVAKPCSRRSKTVGISVRLGQRGVADSRLPRRTRGFAQPLKRMTEQDQEVRARA